MKGVYMNGSSSHAAGTSSQSQDGPFVHPLLRRGRTLRSPGSLIYLYIVLKNQLGTILLALLTLLALLSFLRPLPSLTPTETVGKGGATSVLNRAGVGAGQGFGTHSKPHTGRQLRGVESEGGQLGVGRTATSPGKPLPGRHQQQQQQQHQQQQQAGGEQGQAALFGGKEGQQSPGPPSVSLKMSSSSLSSNPLITGHAAKDDLLALLRKDPDSVHVWDAVMQQRFRDNVPLFGFVHFSSYRMSPVQFAALGFSALAMRGTLRLGSCLWKEKHGGHRVHGNLSALYPGEHHDLKYEAIVVICHLEESTASDYGGVLLYTVDGEDILVYIEDKAEVSSAMPRPPFNFQLAYCTPPLAGNVSPRRMYEWIEYHLHMGMDRLVVYDAGAVDQDVVSMLEAYTEQGISIQIINFRQAKGYQAWDTGRLLSTNDCIYRHRYTAKWVYMAELNEYFSAETGDTLLGLLNAYEGKPYVSLGSRWWSLERCVTVVDKQAHQQQQQQQLEGMGDKGSGGEGFILGNLEPSGWAWGVEKMLFHWPHFYCTNKKDFPKAELCIDYHGFRRYAVDPRLVSSAQIHRTEVPRLGGVDVDADVARLNRFPGIIEENPSKECTKAMKVTEVIDWWVKDPQVSLLAKEAKQQPHAKFKARHKARQ